MKNRFLLLGGGGGTDLSVCIGYSALAPGGGGGGGGGGCPPDDLGLDEA